MATHSSTLAWRIPGTWEPCELPSMGLHRVRHDWRDLAAAAAAFSLGFPGGSDGKKSSCNAGDLSLTPGSRRSPGEDIKRRWQEYTEELYKRDLNDPDNHDGVNTHLELDILECEVKWALGSISMNKASGGDGIPVELFQTLKMMLWKCCTK